MSPRTRRERPHGAKIILALNEERTPDDEEAIRLFEEFKQEVAPKLNTVLKDPVFEIVELSSDDQSVKSKFYIPPLIRDDGIRWEGIEEIRLFLRCHRDLVDTQTA